MTDAAFTVRRKRTILPSLAILLRIDTRHAHHDDEKEDEGSFDVQHAATFVVRVDGGTEGTITEIATPYIIQMPKNDREVYGDSTIVWLIKQCTCFTITPIASDP